MIDGKIVLIDMMPIARALEESQKLFLSLIFSIHYLLIELLFDLLSDLLFELLIHNFYLCLEHADHRFVIRKLKVNTSVVNIH